MNNQSPKNSQARVLKIIKALKGHSLAGLSNSEIAERIKDSRSNVSRALDTLITEGFVIQYEESRRYALSIQAEAIATAHVLELERMQGKINERAQRVLAGAQQ